jgi:hypothetical protein
LDQIQLVLRAVFRKTNADRVRLQQIVAEHFEYPFAPTMNDADSESDQEDNAQSAVEAADLSHKTLQNRSKSTESVTILSQFTAVPVDLLVHKLDINSAVLETVLCILEREFPDKLHLLAPAHAQVLKY